MSKRNPYSSGQQQNQRSQKENTSRSHRNGTHKPFPFTEAEPQQNQIERSEAGQQSPPNQYQPRQPSNKQQPANQQITSGSTSNFSQNQSSQQTPQEWSSSGNQLLEQEQETRTYEVTMTLGQEADPERLEDASLENVNIIAQNSLDSGGWKNTLDSCCHMRTTAQLFENGLVDVHTYLNHYCWIGWFRGRTDVHLYDQNGVLLHTFRFGDWDTSGERREHGWAMIPSPNPAAVASQVSRIGISHDVV